MGYNTDFTGQLDLPGGTTLDQVAELQKYMGEGWREHPEWGLTGAEFYYIDLELDIERRCIEWDGGEKTYGMVEQVNFITGQMQKIWPNFKLTGKMLAQGEDIQDRWMLVMEDGVAKRADIHVNGERVKCPNCESDFFLTEEEAK